jgi:hypothetical protein
LTVPLVTLLGLADHAGEAPGHGPLHADTCRTLADAMAQHRDTEWGVIITSPDGQALSLGGPARPHPTRRSPTSRTPRGSPVAGAGRDSPAASGAGGWTVTLTSEPTAPYP